MHLKFYKLVEETEALFLKLWLFYLGMGWISACEYTDGDLLGIKCVSSGKRPWKLEQRRGCSGILQQMGRRFESRNNSVNAELCNQNRKREEGLKT